MKKIICLAFCFSVLWAEEENPVKQALLQEIQALKSLKLEKLDALEEAEARRWQGRYKQAAELELLEDKNKQLESKYSRLAGDVSRKQERKIQASALTKEKILAWESVRSRQDAFKVSLKQTIEKRAEKIAFDFPIGINERTLLLSQAQTEISDKKENVEKAMELFFQERTDRLLLTQSQTLKTVSSLWEGEGEKTVWQLRLGTIALTELDKESQKSQALLRTGVLQGKTFVWRQDVTPAFAEAIQSSIQKAAQKLPEAWLPLDVLQNKGKGLGYTQKGEKSFSQSVSAWFATGGLVMYPLIGCALLALLLALERFWVYSGRSKKMRGTKKDLMPLMVAQKWDEAIAYCENRGTGMAKAVAEVLRHRNRSRAAAEKSVKEALLVEIPYLEKRLSFISALGASAPLLGLLGTVSGMITLFKVITDVGTNDARILAGGISEALVTTQTGLIIAIPILLIHGYLSEKLDGITAELQETSVEALNAVWPDEED